MLSNLVSVNCGVAVNFNEFWPQYLQICNEAYLYDNNAPDNPFLLIETHKPKAKQTQIKQNLA